MIRVSIVAASAASRSAWAELLRADLRFQMIGGGPTLASVERAWRADGNRPDVLIADSGEAARNLLQHPSRQPPALVLLGDDWSPPEIRRALHYGASAILGHSSSPREITAAIEAAAAGLVVLGAEEKDALLPPPPGLDSVERAPEPLTAREIEVLALVAQGAGNKSIAQRLGLSEHTVKFHVSSVLGKLGAASRTEAAAEGIRRGLVLV